METNIIKPLEKRPLYREEIKSTILDMILNGELKPGDRIIETQWAKEMGVSQAPVREAQQELALLGIVQSIPYKGAFVRGLTYQEMLEAYDIREQLEYYVVDAVVKNITNKQIEEFEQLFACMRQAADDNDHNKYIIFDAAFHRFYINVSKSPLVIRLWTQCSVNETTRIGTNNSKFSLDILAERHDAIFTAFKERNADAAREAILKHFELLKDEIKNGSTKNISSHKEE
jgi:DNA-binding GntR family transcriptional regulator